jgi:hypothetical protein
MQRIVDDTTLLLTAIWFVVIIIGIAATCVLIFIDPRRHRLWKEVATRPSQDDRQDLRQDHPPRTNLAA